MTLGYEKAVENTYGFRDKFKDLFLSFVFGRKTTFEVIYLLGKPMKFDDHIFQLGWFNHQLGSVLS